MKPKPRSARRKPPALMRQLSRGRALRRIDALREVPAVRQVSIIARSSVEVVNLASVSATYQLTELDRL